MREITAQRWADKVNALTSFTATVRQSIGQTKYGVTLWSDGNNIGCFWTLKDLRNAVKL